jgi:hypothetical protein
MLRKGFLLFEVALVVLLVALISGMLFRGYAVFLKASKRNLRYLKLVELSDEKLLDLQLQDLTSEIETQGKFAVPGYSWHLVIGEAVTADVRRCRLTVDYTDRQKLSFDRIVYLTISEE